MLRGPPSSTPTVTICPEASVFRSHPAAGATSIQPGAGWALRRDQPHLSPDAAQSHCPHVSAVEHAGVATACIPLSAQGTQLGLLYLSDDDDGFLSRLDIIEAVAEQRSEKRRVRKEWFSTCRSRW